MVYLNPAITVCGSAPSIAGRTASPTSGADLLMSKPAFAEFG
jgi:hypothetical protein